MGCRREKTHLPFPPTPPTGGQACENGKRVKPFLRKRNASFVSVALDAIDWVPKHCAINICWRSVPRSAAAGMRQMGSRHFRFQEDNVTVSQVWSKRLICHYGGFIAQLQWSNIFRLLKGLICRKAKQKFFPQVALGVEGTWPFSALADFMLFMCCA